MPAHIRELTESKKERDALFTFKDDVGSAIYKVCKHNYEEDGICLSSAAKIIRNQIFEHVQTNEKFSVEKKGQKMSVPRSLVKLISAVISGSGISDNVSIVDSKIAPTISQLILFNVVKHKRRMVNELDKLRHISAFETPLLL